MIAKPTSVSSQLSLLQGLEGAISKYPVAERWILLLSDISENWELFDSESFLRVSDIAFSTAKVLRYCLSQITPSVLIYRYFAPLANDAEGVGVYAKLASIEAFGTLVLSMDASAVNALNLLKQWDDALGTTVPDQPDIIGDTLIKGAEVLT